MLNGIDVNHHRGLVDWQKVKADGIAFAYARATIGLDTDRQWANNARNAPAVGIPLGAFHYLYAHEDPIAQARHFYNTAGRQVLPPWLDLEVAVITLAMVEAWLNEYKRLAGREDTVLYTRANLWDRWAEREPQRAELLASRHGLAVAHYGVPIPTLPLNWQRWLFWQYSESGTVSGVNPPADLDRFNGTLEELEALTMPVDIQRVRALLAEALALLGDTPPTLPPFRWPTEDAGHRVIQTFGANPQIYRQWGLPFGHEGLDLVAPRGSKITAVMSGRVTRVDLAHNAYGLSVRQSCVVDGRTLEVCYAHGETGSLAVKLGDPLVAGQVLFLSDATGNVFGSGGDLSHLHIHVREPGKTYTDPAGNAWPFNVVDPRPFFGL